MKEMSAWLARADCSSGPADPERQSLVSASTGTHDDSNEELVSEGLHVQQGIGGAVGADLRRLATLMIYMSEPNTRVVADEELGFRRLDPVPGISELNDFYGEEYYSPREGRAPDIRRLMSEADAAEPERLWRISTIYADIAHYLKRGGRQRLLDVGCGTGEFVLFAADQLGWDSAGIELSPDGVAVAQGRGAHVVRGTLDDVDREFGGDFDVVTMFNLLEHVPDPIGTLATAHRLLKPGGRIVVQVPNDFASLQVAVRDHLDVDPWWVAIPDHINYFDFDSLEATLDSNGFAVEVRYGTFPMEFFLLAGLDYLTDRHAGSEAHRRRCEFEMSMTGEQRRDVCERFGRAGLGRNVVFVARRVEA